MQLNHYLNFAGETEAAFIFYQSVFGGHFAQLTRYGDIPAEDGQSLSDLQRQQILHVSLPINAYTVLMGSDINEQFCAADSRGLSKGNNHYISINLDHDETEARRLLIYSRQVDTSRRNYRKPFGVPFMVPLPISSG